MHVSSLAASKGQRSTSGDSRPGAYKDVLQVWTASLSCPHRHTGPYHVPQLVHAGVQTFDGDCWHVCPAGDPAWSPLQVREGADLAPSQPVRPTLATGSGSQRPSRLALAPACAHLPPEKLTHTTSPASPCLFSPVSLTPLGACCLPCQSRGLRASPWGAVPRGSKVPKGSRCSLLAALSLGSPWPLPPLKTPR